MKYFKNTELAKLYHVSEKSVRNWIQAAQEGKLDLQLYDHEGRAHIANTARNTEQIKDLADKGKKYRNSRGHKIITPTPDFYKIYNSKEVFDIISNIDIYREVPPQYGYFNGGATQWDMYVQKLAAEDTPNLLTNTVELLDTSTPYLDNLLDENTRVNIIDIGPGNAYPVRKLLAHFIEAKRLNRYIAIDISHAMLDIAEKNIQEWFGESANFERYVRDINHQQFEDLLVSDSFDRESPVVNIILYLGSTIANFRRPNQSLSTIHESMGKNDLLVFSRKLDTESTRRYFDFVTAPQQASRGFRGKDILDLLNINDSLYELEQYFDERKWARHVQVRLKVALSLNFTLDGKPRVVELNKNDPILLWRAKHQSIMETIQQFDGHGFDMLQATRSKNQESFMSISQIKTDNPL